MNSMDSQKPSVTKTYSVGFSHYAEFKARNEVKKPSQSRDILCKIIKQSDWQRYFLGQNSKTRLLNCLE